MPNKAPQPQQHADAATSQPSPASATSPPPFSKYLIVSLKSTQSCGTMPITRLRLDWLMARRSWPSIRMAPEVTSKNLGRRIFEEEGGEDRLAALGQAGRQ